MEHMEPLIQGHFDEDPDRTMTSVERDAITVNSRKKATDPRELLRMKKKKDTEGDELRACRAKAKVLTGDAAANQSPSGSLSPIDDVFGALREKLEEAPLAVLAEVLRTLQFIQKLLTLANDHEMLKGPSIIKAPNTNEQTLSTQPLNTKSTEIAWLLPRYHSPAESE